VAAQGGDLSDKTAQEEFGLTREEIVKGSPRGEAALPAAVLRVTQAKTELAHINRELKRLKNQIAALEDRKSKLIAGEIQ
jgi:hypothetical protein